MSDLFSEFFSDLFSGEVTPPPTIGSEATPFQPTLPPEVLFTEAELNFMELSPAGLFPQNQNSNFGLTIRKFWCDRVQQLADQLTTMYNEKFPATSTQFIDDHERMYGLPALSSATIAARRQNVLNRVRVGAFTRTRRKQIVESYIATTFGGAPIQLTPSGWPLNAGGSPLYGEGGDISTLYAIVENIATFSFTIRIKNTIAPDEVGMRRELDRVVPAHLSYTIIYVAVP